MAAEGDHIRNLIARLVIPEELRFPDKPNVVITVVGELGRGGFGVTLHAKMRETVGGAVTASIEREVCLKLIPNIGGLAAAEFTALAGLVHDNVVRVLHNALVDLDLREPARRQSFLAVELEYLSGGSLEDRIRRKDFSDSQALRWMLDIARGIAYLHSRMPKKLHRDLKPANVCLSATGIAKLVDFGASVELFARTSGSAFSFSSEFGTSWFMSPERRIPERPTYSTPDDVWAMGLVFLQLWTRRTNSEISETDPAVDMEDVNDFVEAVREGSDEFEVRANAGLAALIASMLSRDAKDRLKAAEVVDHVQALLVGGGGEIPETPAPTPEAPSPSFEADLFLAVDGLRATKNFAELVRYLTSSLESVRSRTAAELRSAALAMGADRDAVKTALRGTTAESAAPLLSWIEGREADEAEFRRKAAEVERWKDAKDVRSLLRTVSTATERADVRVLAADAVWSVWEAYPGERKAIELALGLVGESTEESRTLHSRVEAGKEAARCAAEAEAERVRKAEEERRAREADRRAEEARRQAMRPRLPTKQVFSLAGHTSRVVAILAHPSRPLLLSGSADHTVRVWDLDSRSLLRTLAGHTSWVNGFALDRAGRRLATGSGDDTVRLWDLDSGACLRTLAGHSNNIAAVAWEAAGSLVASGSRDVNVCVWHADSGALRHTLAGHSGWVFALAAHPADDLLASGSHDTTVRVWRWSSGAHVRTLAGHTGYVASLAASAAWLVSGSYDKSVRVWSWVSGACARVLDGFTGQLHLNSLAWRDSALVTLDGEDWDKPATVRVWNASSADASAWSCVGSLASKASSGCGVAVVGGVRVACAAPGDSKTIAVWAAE